MKKSLFLTILFLLSINGFSQNLLETALKNKSAIILNEAFIISDGYFSVDYYETPVDKTLIEDFRSQLKNQEKTIWNTNDFKNKIIVEKGQKIDIDKVLASSSDLNPTQALNLKIALKKFNSNDGEWRSFPLKVSRPIYSKQKDYAIIGFVNGNESGEIALYHLENNEWKFAFKLNNWVY